MRWLAVLALAACDWSLHRMQEQPRCATHAATPLTPTGTCDVLPPAGIVALGDEPIARPARTRALLERGRDRYDRFCAACHGVAGDGDADVAAAMTLRRPPTLLVPLSDDRVFDAVSSGYGVMPEYASVLAPRDRWAVVEYVHVLRGRDVALDALSPALREEAVSWLH